MKIYLGKDRKAAGIVFESKLRIAMLSLFNNSTEIGAGGQEFLRVKVGLS